MKLPKPLRKDTAVPQGHRFRPIRFRLKLQGGAQRGGRRDGVIYGRIMIDGPGGVIISKIPYFALTKFKFSKRGRTYGRTCTVQTR
eukprot:SAG31_NODE_130_length_23424_cov_45.648802_14_plen_86_part_00